MLLAADAHPSVLAASIELLPSNERRFDLAKISHHGSKANLTRSLIGVLDCSRFAISTDGSRHHHPNPEAIARLLSANTKRKRFYFNYRHEEAAVWDDDELKRNFNYECEFASDTAMGRLKIAI
ncbi:hypothetical protein QBK93_11135 [Rhizobium leguminosarum]|uniref:hypothetical protein n=1 Tax=Rhizobium leguminosarum TaxID=384 RepID=UPI0024A9FDBE|nr:hypothetical protein [Rhizobium leguminosarum]MDI5925227.1 hypothetical protein [Rhizobium leguminosarum]